MELCPCISLFGRFSEVGVWKLSYFSYFHQQKFCSLEDETLVSLSIEKSEKHSFERNDGWEYCGKCEKGDGRETSSSLVILCACGRKVTGNTLGIEEKCLRGPAQLLRHRVRNPKVLKL